LVQEAPQNAPPGGAFQLVLYRGSAAPIEVDWSWQPASSAAVLQSAVVLFDRSGGLPIAPAWQTIEPANSARRLSLSTTFFWAMAFITAKKIARGQPAAAFALLRMMHHARAEVRDRHAGRPRPTWGSIAAPREALPPLRLHDQLVDLLALITEMEGLQRTTDGAGGVVTEEAVAAVRRFVELIALDAGRLAAGRIASP